MKDFLKCFVLFLIFLDNLFFSDLQFFLIHLFNLTSDGIDFFNFLNIFPNPTEKNLNVSLQNKSIYKIMVYSQIGALIEEFNINNCQEFILDVESYNKGVYFVRILNSNNETSTATFVKK